MMKMSVEKFVRAMPIFFLAFAAFVLLCNATASGRDWPMWRYDAARGNASPHELAPRLHLQWTRALPTPRTAWPASQKKLQFDAVVQPIIAGRLMVVGSTTANSIAAYDMRSGKEVWRFFTEAPVRFAPVAHRERIYAGSDDGRLYCLDAASGRLLWKMNGGPTDQRLIGNGRLTSVWPIRGGPVVVDDTVYFAAGIWPFMGIFIHAVDANTGQNAWLNSDTGSRWIVHPHGAPSFGSIVPQGYLAAFGDQLIVPGGRSLPAILDRGAGEVRHFDFGGKGDGGWNVSASRNFFVAGKQAFTLDGAALGDSLGAALGAARADVLSGGLLIDGLTAHQLPDSISILEVKDRKGRPIRRGELRPKKSWTLADGNWRTLAKAGERIYAGRENEIASFHVGRAMQTGHAQTPEWTASIEGEPAAALAGDGRLLVVTKAARIYCFGPQPATPIIYELNRTPAEPPAAHVEDRWSRLADTLLQKAQVKEGYAVSFGIGGGRLIEEVVRKSNLHVIVIEPNAETANRFRRRMLEAGLYGDRVTVCEGEPANFPLPPYLANLIFSEPADALAAENAERLARAAYHALRPYGGVACFELTSAKEAFAHALEHVGDAGAVASESDGLIMLRRTGALPGAADWTHHYANAANTLVSKDKRVKAPLGLLWFGGPSNDRILPRHGHGPSPQVAGGRLVIEGPDLLRCVDVYTGRVLWERELPGLGSYYNITSHFAGAGEIGGNYVTLPDAVYVVYGESILELDAATGRTTKTFRLQADKNIASPAWGYLAVDGNFLVATASPVALQDAAKNSFSAPTSKNPAAATGEPPPKISDELSAARFSSASRQLVVFDRRTGKQLWRRQAEANFRHNAIAVAAGKLFCIDNLSADKLETLRRRGVVTKFKPKLLALDAQTGAELWSTEENVFGTFLSYSVEHDVLLQAGAPYRDRAKDEAQRGLIAYRGRDGKPLWKDLKRRYNGPCLLWRDKIITNGAGGFMLELLTGKSLDWRYQRMYGCNTAVGSEHLLTFRSGAAGFCDLSGDSGTGNLGGFRSSCTSNLIVADGVLNAPDYTRTCTCAYQNQCSLALVHMPEAEMWTFSSLASAPRRFAVNLGAPGDRRDPSGVLWFDAPSTGGKSPSLPVEIKGDFHAVRHHASRISAAPHEGLPWVLASGLVGVESITQKLSGGKSNRSRKVTVRLYFAELENLGSGARVFDVLLQGKTVLQALDIAQQTGGAFRGHVFEFTDVNATTEVTIAFHALQGQPCISGVEIIEPAANDR